MRRIHSSGARWLALTLWILPAAVSAHSGPPFPIVSDRVAGAYQLSLWTDPDATSDGSPAGRFWVMIRQVDGGAVASDTRALITIRPLDRPGAALSAGTTVENGDVSRQFASLLMDHEGPFAVQATISGTRGSAVVEATVDATYDLRPARWLIAVYLMPFLGAGFLWIKLLIRRRRLPPAKR